MNESPFKNIDLPVGCHGNKEWHFIGCYGGKSRF